MLGFQVVPDEGYLIKSVQGCEGNLLGDQFVTLPIVRDCAITVEFHEHAIFADGLETQD